MADDFSIARVRRYLADACACLLRAEMELTATDQHERAAALTARREELIAWTLGAPHPAPAWPALPGMAVGEPVAIALYGEE